MSRSGMRARFGMRAICSLAAAAVASLGLASPPAAAGEWDAVQSWETARITRIVDADTVIVTDAVTGEQSRIRFLGVNAPEKPTPAHPGQCGWWQAMDALAGMAPIGTEVRLASLDRSSSGRAQRPQRTVLAWNPVTQAYDIDLAWALAERGWVIWFTVARESAMSAKYRAVIESARERRVGLWDPAVCGDLEQPEAKLDLRIGRAPGSTSAVDEWVSVRNTGGTAIDISGWLLRDSGNIGWYTFPGGTVLAPGDYRVVHTGPASPDRAPAATSMRVRRRPSTRHRAVARSSSVTARTCWIGQAHIGPGASIRASTRASRIRWPTSLSTRTRWAARRAWSGRGRSM